MKICIISAVMTLRRSDKQPDRVEISPEQLSDASSHAEVSPPSAHQTFWLFDPHSLFFSCIEVSCWVGQTHASGRLVSFASAHHCMAFPCWSVLSPLGHSFHFLAIALRWFIWCAADVQTQAMYQMLDEGFIGLIFSVFNQDKGSKVSVFTFWSLMFLARGSNYFAFTLNAFNFRTIESNWHAFSPSTKAQKENLLSEYGISDYTIW